MPEIELKECVSKLLSRNDIATSVMLPFDGYLLNDLRNGKIVLLGASKDKDNLRVEGFANGWFWESTIERARKIIGNKISFTKIPLDENRSFIFVANEYLVSLSSFLREVGLCGLSEIKIL